MNSSLDISLLEKVSLHGFKVTARCPACTAAGADRSGNHLFINAATGKFGCAAHPGDRAHRREIFRLVGIHHERGPAEERQWRKRRFHVATGETTRHRITTALRAKRSGIIAGYPWTEAEVRADSPEQRTEWLHDQRRCLAALFDPSDIIWCGDTYQSGQDGRHAACWQSVNAWQEGPEETAGPLVTPATWHPGTVSRSGVNVATAPFLVLDFDGFDGKAPTTPEELRQHIAASLAITRWLRVALEWRLAALLFTGSKSLHAWFHMPPRAALESLKAIAPTLGVDTALIGRPEHPCRLPGWPHPKTGQLSRLLWLQRLDGF